MYIYIKIERHSCVCVCFRNVSARICYLSVVMIFARARELSTCWDIITRNVTAIKPTTKQQSADLSVRFRSQALLTVAAH